MAESKGLPMTAKWDPEKLQHEVAELEALAQKPFFPRAAGYIKRTGPGLLQSAMTLGAGSATASVLAGASFGYKLLWVQPVAMFLGVMMLAALSNVVLSTGERPYKSFRARIEQAPRLSLGLGHDHVVDYLALSSIRLGCRSRTRLGKNGQCPQRRRDAQAAQRHLRHEGGC